MSKFVGNIGRLFFGIVMIGAFSLAFGGSDSFTDPRDKQAYRTVRIGDLTWMAENLNFQTDNSWCYDNDESNCQKHGRLYDWHTAITACPTGWHLPTRDDWNDLVKAAGGDVAGMRLKSTTGWNRDGNGTDYFGFSALPGGFRSADYDFSYIGVGGFWWSATEDDANDAWYRIMGSGSSNSSESSIHKGDALSVRCVRE
jgi:uncharacterized protein (TIGR02145 family)